MVKSRDATTEVQEPVGRRERRRDENRRRLLEAAEAVFVAKGLQAATINEITEAADLGFGTFYGHFESKEQIAEAVAESLARRKAADLGAITADDPAEALAAVLVAIARDDRDNPGLTRFLLEAGAESGALEREYGLLIWQLVAEGVRAGSFDDRHLAYSPWAVASLILGTLFYRQQATDPESFEQGLVYHALRMLGVDGDEASAIGRRVTGAA